MSGFTLRARVNEEHTDYVWLCLVPCFVCGKDLDCSNASDGMQAKGGVKARFSGGYGSTAYDPPGNESLLGIVCDDCLRERRKRVLVETVIGRRDPLTAIREWDET